MARQSSMLKDTIRQAGKHCGVVATGTANLAERFEQGFRMLALGIDGGLLLRSLHESLAAVGRDRKIRSGFRVEELYDRVRKHRSDRESSDDCKAETIPCRPDRRLLRGRRLDEISRHRLVGLRGTARTSNGSSFASTRPRSRPTRSPECNGVIVLTPSVTAETVAQSRDLLAIGRFGVGYDAVDVDACTQADVVVFITAGAVDRSVAEATVGWMIALTHHLRTKDILVRTGRWDERSRYMGRELRDRTFGAIGLGGIGRATVGLLQRVRHEDAAGVRSLRRRPDRRPAGRRLVGARRAAGRGRFRLDPLPAHRADPRPDRPP